MIVLPLHDRLQELRSTKIMSRLLLAAPKHALHNRLGGNTGMIATREIKGLVALHTMPSDKDVLERGGERVATVKFSGDVGRGDGYCEAALLLGEFAAMLNVVFGFVEAFFIPPVVPSRLDDLWDVCLGEGAVVQRLKDLLLAFLGRLNVFAELLLVGLLLFLFLLTALAGGLAVACGSLRCLFRLESGILFCLLPFLLELLLGLDLLLYALPAAIAARRILAWGIGVGGVEEDGFGVGVDGRG
ncbi:hypothetical protein BDV96DRAFT_592107 [Lophiotrema nucula]|uniref:Uncharacterized protein n=1 Tax=Lophiotrema nucula TaxID=690887 RepID=A0A6A5YHQ5_9PLEO|nr:hypothetical protein BDV96DRAFT_592107 [Lophiotrema nucula]